MKKFVKLFFMLVVLSLIFISVVACGSDENDSGRSTQQSVESVSENGFDGEWDKN